MSSERAAILLFFLGIVGVLTIRKLGYLDYFTSEKVGGWFRDVSDAAGFSQDRRSFLDIQMAIGKANDIKALWELTSKALIKMDLDQALIHIKGQGSMHWIRQGYDLSNTPPTFLMRMELPLVTDKQNHPYGKLILFKDLRREPLSHYTLRRMEHLRRNITGVLARIRHS
jgi:UDP-GlcNAc:undecaprenyl-phosphate GlcNAc-1-phosphate transferase